MDNFRVFFGYNIYMLTKRQKQIYEFINEYVGHHEVSPTIQEIANRFHLSVSTIHEHLQSIEKKGYLKKDHGQARAMETQDPNEGLIWIPLLGTIAAGQPIEAIEIPNETIAITKSEIGKQCKHYALRVQGNSMIDEGIFDGDIVVIRKQEMAENGQTVVAVVDNNQATLKKLYRENGKFRLQPANTTLFPIYRDEVEVRGVVVKIIRNLESRIDQRQSRNEKYLRKTDYSWDYRGEKTKPHTHGIHTYPAMFIPQVGRRLLETYSKEGDTICDIFCGSGSALVESRLTGRNAYGIDLNPLAIFLAKAKTTPINPQKLTKEYITLLARAKKIKDRETQRPDFKNIDFWFKDKIIVKLAKLKKAIREIKDEAIRNFLMVAFSETARYSSNTKTGEFKLVRVKGDKLEKHDPDVISIFRKHAEKNIAGMTDFYKDAKKDSWTKIIYGDSSKDNGIKANSIDCIITSPPYGDSRTTVAYGQFSRLSAQWIDVFDDPNDASGLDNDLLGGKATKNLTHTLSSNYLKESLEKIATQDETRAKDVLSFNLGLNDCLKQAHRILKPGKYFCLVVGNRLVKQVRIPTDFIIAELAEKIGFTCEDIIVRNIPGKRMPIKNSPTNVAGALEETINKESIVVLRKN